MQADPRLNLLAKIDYVLMGERSGFFERSQVNASSGSDRSSDSSSESASASGESSSSGDEGASSLAPSQQPSPAPAGASARTGSLTTTPGRRTAGSVVALSRKPERLAAAAAAIEGNSAKADGSSHTKAVLPKPAESVTSSKDAVPTHTTNTEPATDPAGPAQANDHAAEEDDSDINDEMIAAAFRAKLEGNTEDRMVTAPKEKPTEPSHGGVAAVTTARVSEPRGGPTRTRGTESEAGQAVPKRSRRTPPSPPRRGAPPNATASAPPDKTEASERLRPPPPPATEAKAWSAPPPPPPRVVRGAPLWTRQLDGSDTGAKPKKPAMPIEVPAPPLFDQWLACLKFVTGWNDQRSHTTKEVKAALCEHLTEEGIENTGTVDQLCSTVVPLLLDLRRIDGAVVKNLKAEVLRGLKIVQVSILRIVTFELCRERDAKAAQKKKDATSGGLQDSKTADSLPRPAVHGGATYLASDISSLAKVVQHFRFDRTFSEGLHQLILSIRRQKRVMRSGYPATKRHLTPAGGPDYSGAGPSKKRKADATIAARAKTQPAPAAVTTRA